MTTVDLQHVNHIKKGNIRLKELLKYLGNRIAVFRKIKGISQNELADGVSVEIEEIEAIEKGKSDPSITLLFKISQFLRTRLEYFFPAKKDNEDFFLLYQRLKQPNKDKIFHYARHLLREQTKIIDFSSFKKKSPKDHNTKILKIPIEADFVFLVDDASMEELIPKGTPVFCRSQPTAKDGNIAIVEVFRLGTICRKISYDFKEGTVILDPLNPEFTQTTYEHEQVKVIGLVLNL